MHSLEQKRAAILNLYLEYFFFMWDSYHLLLLPPTYNWHHISKISFFLSQKNEHRKRLQVLTFFFLLVPFRRWSQIERAVSTKRINSQNLCLCSTITQQCRVTIARLFSEHMVKDWEVLNKRVMSFWQVTVILQCFRSDHWHERHILQSYWQTKIEFPRQPRSH